MGTVARHQAQHHAQSDPTLLPATGAIAGLALLTISFTLSSTLILALALTQYLPVGSIFRI